MTAAPPDPLFVAVPGSGKLACAVCGRMGYPVSNVLRKSWQDGCKRGHAPCDRCGKQLAVKLDGSPRRHARCPARRQAGEGT